MITKSISSTEDRKAFYGIAREAVEDNVPVAVRNRGRRGVVIVPESEYNSILETLYVTRGKNGESLLRSREQAKAGLGRDISMDELNRMLEE